MKLFRLGFIATLERHLPHKTKIGPWITDYQLCEMYEEQVDHREKEQFWTEVAEFMQMRGSNKTGQWAGKHYYNSFLNAYSDVKLSKEDKA